LWADIDNRSTQQVDAVGLDRERNRAHRLSGVGMEEHVVPLADFSHSTDRLERANLVLSRHDRDENGLRLQRLLNGGSIDDPVATDWQLRDVPALSL
jgi:hypothetical protein